MASLKSEPTCKLINRIPGLRGLISSLTIQQAFLKPCLVNLISKDTNLVFYISTFDSSRSVTVNSVYSTSSEEPAQEHWDKIFDICDTNEKKLKRH